MEEVGDFWYKVGHVGIEIIVIMARVMDFLRLYTCYRQ